VKIKYPLQVRQLKSVVKKTISLHKLSVGQSAFIRELQGHPDHIHRLEEFGLRNGSRIEMFRTGNPCIIRLAGNKICLRADGLVKVLVEPISGQ
jgi:ferrous iron transport protein A